MYALTTQSGYLYRGPDGMPLVRVTRSGIRTLALKDKLIDWKAEKVSIFQLTRLRRACLHDMKPQAFSKTVGLD